MEDRVDQHMGDSITVIDVSKLSVNGERGRMIKKSFFDAVSIASMERMHSQMIAWILSPDCEAISPDSKSAILAAMCGVPDQELGGLKRCTTEWEHIDVVVETEKSVVFIENKIKSSQSHGQLSHYDSVIDETKILDGRRPQKVMLSLVGEIAKAPGWRNVTYQNLEGWLASVPLATGDNEDAAIVRTYIASLMRLTDVVDSFSKNPDQYKNVFEEGSMSRAEKSELPPCESLDCQYIRDMQLETVLQRLFLQRIAERIALDARFFTIGETRGVALLDIKEPNALHPVKESGYTFHWGIQFQGKSVKVQLESGYDDQGKWMEASPEMKRYMGEVLFSRVRGFVDQPQVKSDWRFNPPHGSGSTYCSISKPKGQLRWGGALDVAVESYSASLKEALKVASELSNYLARTQPGG